MGNRLRGSANGRGGVGQHRALPALHATDRNLSGPTKLNNNVSEIGTVERGRVANPRIIPLKPRCGRNTGLRAEARSGDAIHRSANS